MAFLKRYTAQVVWATTLFIKVRLFSFPIQKITFHQHNHSWQNIVLLTFPCAECRITLPYIFHKEEKVIMMKDFKAFVMRGNVMDLAVGVIIGGAFGKIVSSLVGDILMPLIGLVIGGIDFSGLAFIFGSAKVTYGNFINNSIDFIIIAFVVFLMVRAISKLQKPAPAPAPTTKDCPYCFTAIPLQATRCPNCTSELNK